jgi:hypothetical protein
MCLTESTTFLRIKRYRMEATHCLSAWRSNARTLPSKWQLATFSPQEELRKELSFALCWLIQIMTR